MSNVDPQLLSVPGGFRRSSRRRRLTWMFLAGSAIAGSLFGKEPDLPPILVPPYEGNSTIPKTPPSTIPKTKVQKVTPLDVEPVPARGSTIPSGPLPGSTIPGDAPVLGPATTIPGPLPIGPVPDTVPPAGGTIPGGPFPGSFGGAPTGFGLHVVICEDFANPFVATQRTDQGPVQDCILGARIQGRQTTDVQTRINFVPSERMGLAQLELTGNTRNQTRAMTPQASIDSAGDSRFLVTKALEFNGETVATRTPAAYLNTSLQSVGARTTLTGIPLLGPLANAVALSQAEQKRPEAERIAAYKITEQVVPQFNGSVDAELVKLNQGLASLRSQLQSVNLLPESLFARSSEQAMSLSVRLTPEEQAAPAPFVTEQGLSIAIHESLLAGFVTRSRLGGLQIPDTELAKVDAQLARLLGRPVDDDAVAPMPLFSLVLAERNPLVVRFRDGRIEALLTTAIQPVAGPRISERVITVPLQITLGASSVRIAADAVQVDSTVPGADATANELIRQGVAQQLKPIEIPRTYTLPLSEGRLMPISIAAVNAREGWLVIRLAATGGGPLPAGNPLASPVGPGNVPPGGIPTPTPASTIPGSTIPGGTAPPATFGPTQTTVPYRPAPAAAPASPVPGPAQAPNPVPAPTPDGPLLVPQGERSILPRFSYRPVAPRYRYRASSNQR